MTPRQGTCQESSSVRRRTAVVRRTPSPPLMIRSTEWKSIAGFTRVPVRSHFSGEQRSNQAVVPRFVCKAQCACKSGTKKNGCGKERSDKPARETIDRSTKAYPCRARSKCVGHPDCHTCRSEHTRHIQAEWPTHKSARRRLCTAMVADEQRQRNNLWRCAAETFEDYHSGKRDITSSGSPGILPKE
jgi:hypothetical protein